MVTYSQKTIKKLFALSGNICAMPSCQSQIIDSEGVVLGEICHIRAKSVAGPRFDPAQSESNRNDFRNLILLCGAHHKIIDTEFDLYTVEALLEMKSIHEELVGRSEQERDQVFAKQIIDEDKKIKIDNGFGNVAVNSPGAIQAKIIHINASGKKISIEAPSGTIGADQAACRYMQHLIKRYNDYASQGTARRAKFSYGAISNNIETLFGAQWKLLPMKRWDEVITYLQSRIDRTFIAKVNKGKGQKSYSSYGEYLVKYEK